jgi:hypothetical protein
MFANKRRMATLGRQTILPPPPSRTRAFLAYVMSLWFLVVTSLHRKMHFLAGLLGRARRSAELIVARLTPAAPVSGVRQRGTLPLFAAPPEPMEDEPSSMSAPAAAAASRRRSALTAVG